MLGWLACAPPPAASPAPAAPVEVQLELRGLSPEYQRDFADPELVGALGSALAACTGDPAVLTVDYQRGLGELRLAAPWRDVCSPAEGPDGVDLAPVTPIGRALAGYRNALAVRYDRRLTTFSAVVDLDGCALALAGQIPPDGTAFAPCPAAPCALTASGAVRLSLAQAGCLAKPGGPTPR